MTARLRGRIRSGVVRAPTQSAMPARSGSNSAARAASSTSAVTTSLVHPVLAGNQRLAEIADATQAGRQLNLHTMGRRKIDGVIGVKSQPYAFVGDVVAGETLVEQLARRTKEGLVLSSHDDPTQGAGLIPPHRRPVGFDDEAPLGIEPQCETVTSESVHRDGNVHVLQECSHTRRLVRVVQARGEVDPQSGRVHDGVVGRSGLLGGPFGDLIGTPVLRSAVQRHEPDFGAQGALLFDSGHRQELGQIHLLRLARHREVVPRPRPYSCAQTDFNSVYASSTWWPISRPQPDSLYPPKGSAASKTL